MRPVQRGGAGDEDFEPGGVRGEAGIDEGGRQWRRPSPPSPQPVGTMGVPWTPFGGEDRTARFGVV